MKSMQNMEVKERKKNNKLKSFIYCVSDTKYNHIFAIFFNLQKFHFFTKSCILNAFGWDSVTERLTLVYKEICSYWIKVSFLGNQAWRPRNEGFIRKLSYWKYKS